MDYTFRKITFAEFDKLNPLFPDSHEQWIKYKDQRMKQFDKKDIDVYVIEHSGRFIGEVSAFYSCYSLSTEAIPNVRAYLSTFRLEEKYQGKGLGQELMRFALDDLAKRGYTQFTIGVEEDNEAAKHIYFKLGFTMEIDHGCGDEFDPTDYTLYLKTL